MNWGKGIIAGMLVFMLFIISMCIYMFRIPADEYDHQYYEKGLRFDRDYDRERQVGIDHAQPLITRNGQTLLLKFTAPVTGKINFIRPSNQALDKEFQFNSGASDTATISLAAIWTGQWQLVLEWESNHKAYLYHQEIYIQ
jgi:hypothetical protein